MHPETAIGADLLKANAGALPPALQQGIYAEPHNVCRTGEGSVGTQLAMVLAVPPGAQGTPGFWKWLLGMAVALTVFYVWASITNRRTSARKPLTQQEHELREVLRNTKPNHGHYIHVDPDNYIRIDKKRAEEIAKEEGFYDESLNMSADWYFHKQDS